MKEKRYCLLTNDVEEHSIWFNSLRMETGNLVKEEGIPLLLDLYRKYQIKATFFFTGVFAETFPSVVTMVAKGGHEIGSHGYSHEVSQAFDVLNFEEQVKHLSKSRKILEDLSGRAVISFRAPALRINGDTALALRETGFKIDSSVASQRFDYFLSFGGLSKLKWLTSPRVPYRTKPDTLFERGAGGIVEIPISALNVPYIGTTMRIFPHITKMLRMVLHVENGMNAKPIVFLIHPNELIDESKEPRIIARRTKNRVSSFLRDYVRSVLKAKNLGLPAARLYEDQIKYFTERNYRFATLTEYCTRTNLLKD